MKARSRLLLVEADALLADVTAFRLELLGYQVETVHQGDAALKLVRERKPDLFIINVTLPGLSGTALIEQLATDQETARLPVLAISVGADMEIVQRTISAGATDFLVVPYDPLVLEDKVARLLSDANAKSEKEAKNDKTSAQKA